jgi:porin
MACLFTSATFCAKHWLPFLRAGWADAGDALYETSFSGGFGYSRDPSKGLFGVGLNWSRPNADTFGTELEDQVTFEAFWMFELAKFFELTPSVQYIINPALNPECELDHALRSSVPSSFLNMNFNLNK